MKNTPLYIFLCLVFAAGPALASKTVTSPYVTGGRLQVESKTGYVIDDDDDVGGAWQQVFGANYGITDRWATEVEISSGRGGASSDDAEIQGIEWQNKFQFTDRGEGRFDFGGRVSYFHNTTGDPDEIEAKLMAGRKAGKVAYLGNAAISREIGEDAHDSFEWGTSFSASYAHSDHFKPAIEMYNNFGDFDDELDDQNHQLGPAAYGKINDQVGYNAGVLFGISDGAPDAQLKAVFDYSF